MSDWRRGKPLDGGPYLTYRPAADGYGSYMGVAYWFTVFDDIEPHWMDDTYHGPSAVSHWMPLPEKP